MEVMIQEGEFQTSTLLRNFNISKLIPDDVVALLTQDGN